MEDREVEIAKPKAGLALREATRTRQRKTDEITRAIREAKKDYEEAVQKLEKIQEEVRLREAILRDKEESEKNIRETAAGSALLRRKKAVLPCSRCGNESFLIHHLDTSLCVSICDFCGCIYEHFVPILENIWRKHSEDLNES